jgi:hypothetical protein
VEDGFGVALIPAAIISRELREGSVQLLQVDREMPVVPLIGSFSTSPENPLFEQIALVAQEAAQTFARSVPDEIARLPIGCSEATAWEFARRGQAPSCSTESPLMVRTRTVAAHQRI